MYIFYIRSFYTFFVQLFYTNFIQNIKKKISFILDYSINMDFKIPNAVQLKSLNHLIVKNRREEIL